MKYGLNFFPTSYTMQPAELAKLAEERGFESLWFPEHTHIPVSRRSPWPGGPELPKEYLHSYDPFVALTAAAAATRDLKVATGVCLIVERDPITTAKAAATLDVISNGRFIFGIGGGWNFEEMENHGTNPKTRFRLLRERVLAMKALWSDDDQPSFRGDMVSFDPVWAYPKPVQRPNPPIVMGGDGPTTFDRVIEFCDGWLPIARGHNATDAIAAKAPELRARAKAAGRDPDTISLSLFGCPPTPEAIATIEKAGFERAIFGLRTAPRDDVLKQLDELARAMR